MKPVRKTIFLIALLASLQLGSARPAFGMTLNSNQAQQSGAKESTANIRFKVFPEHLADMVRFHAEIIDVATDKELAKSVSFRDLKAIDGVRSIEITGDVVDGRQVALGLQSFDFVGAWQQRSESFSLHPGDSGIIEVRFPEMGLLEIVVPEPPLYTEGFVNWNVKDGMTLSFLQTADQNVGFDIKQAGSHFISWLIVGVAIPEPDFAVESKWLKLSFAGTTLAFGESTLFIAGLIPVGKWDLVVTSNDLSWASETMHIEVFSNKVIRAEIKEPVELVKVKFEHSKIGAPEDPSMKLFSKEKDGPFLENSDTTFVKGEIGSSDFRISSHSSELLVAGRFSRKGSNDFDLVFSKVGLEEGAPISRTIACWPNELDTPNAVLPAVKSSSFSHILGLTVKPVGPLPLPKDFPAQGVWFVATPSGFSVHGLPKGTYGITRVDSRNEKLVEEIIIEVKD